MISQHAAEGESLLWQINLPLIQVLIELLIYYQCLNDINDETEWKALTMRGVGALF